MSEDSNYSDDGGVSDIDDLDDDLAFESETHDSYNMGKPDTIFAVEEIYDKYHNQLKKTRPILDRFEYTKILGIRAQQIANGATPLVSTESLTDIIDIVKKEYVECKIPLFIKRNLSNGESEYWRIEDFSNYMAFI